MYMNCHLHVGSELHLSWRAYSSFPLHNQPICSKCPLLCLYHVNMSCLLADKTLDLSFSYDRQVVLFAWQKHLLFCITLHLSFFYDKQVVLFAWQNTCSFYISIHLSFSCDKQIVLFVWHFIPPPQNAPGNMFLNCTYEYPFPMPLDFAHFAWQSELVAYISLAILGPCCVRAQSGIGYSLHMIRQVHLNMLAPVISTWW